MTDPYDDSEYALTDDQLRLLAESQASGRWMRPLAQEVLDLRVRVAALEAVDAVARDFINERPEYVNSCRNAHPDADHDYYRWQGGAEGRRQLAERLGWTVPYEHGEKTGPKDSE